MNLKLEKLIDRTDKREIIMQIKSDLLDNYKNISITELDILSNNIYDFCLLVAYNISNDDISKYILEKNNYYYTLLSDDDRNKLISTDYNTLKILTKLKKKYVKILKK